MTIETADEGMNSVLLNFMPEGINLPISYYNDYFFKKHMKTPNHFSAMFLTKTKLALKPSLFICLLSLIFIRGNSQIIGTNAFINNNYLEVGISDCGSYGSNVAPPMGYHPNAALPGLGFVVDHQQNGWFVGTPNYCGDYFVPGSPVEGFALSFNGNHYRNSNTGTICGDFDIPRSVGYPLYKPGTFADTMLWKGAIAGVEITQQTVLPADSLFFITEIVLCNTTGAAINSVYYGRNVDPDNEQPWTGDYNTTNLIVSQPTPPGPVDALVTATGLSYGCYVGLGTRDSRARANHGSFFTSDAPDYYNGTGLTQTVGSSAVVDQAISLGYSLGTIGPGECICFSFAYVLNATQLASALSATLAISVAADSVDITSTGSAVVCSGDSVDISLGGGATGYTWTWSPAIGLSSTTGMNVTAAPPVTTTYTANGVNLGLSCSNVSVSITVTVDNPVAVAGVDKTTCPGGPISIGAAPTAGYTYSWSPASGLSSSVASMPTVTLPTPGIYDYILTVTNTVTGCTDSDTVRVEVQPFPTVDFDLPDEICVNADGLVTFTGTVVPGVTYIWNFGAGSTPTTASTIGPHLVNWSTTGKKYVTLAIAVGPCTTATVIDSIQVWPIPTAGITPVANQCITGNSFSFINTGTYDPGATFSWTFSPDGTPSTSTLENPTGISFGTAGIKTVTLIVTDHGCVSNPVSITFEVYPLPQPDFSWTGICFGDVTQFTDLTPGTVTVWDWDLVDAGTTSALQNPSHTYSAPGLYNVTLGTTDQNGCFNEVCHDVIIHTLPVPDFSYVNKCFNTRTDFTNLSTLVDPYGSTIAGYTWNFGDPASGSSNTSTDQNPIHNYTTTGNYTVTLTVVSSEGCTQTITRSIYVPPVPYLIAEGDSACAGFSATLTVAGQVPGTTLEWFQTETGPTPVFIGSSVYQTPPLFTTTTFWVGMIDSDGCRSARAPATAVVLQNPIIDWIASSTTVEVPNAIVEFQVRGTTSNYGIKYVLWDFGDGTTSNELSPVHQYTKPGFYTITLTVIDNWGCESRLIRNHHIRVEENIRIFAPNAFTPNGDGLNDVFQVETQLVKSLTVRVYDRWGQLTFESPDLYFKWNGNDTKNAALPEGNYTWTITATAYDNRIINKSGTVLLLR